MYGHQTTQTRLQSDTADNIAWGKWTNAGARTPQLSSSLSRIAFVEESSALPLHRLLELAAQKAAGAKPPIVLVGRSRRMATDSHKQELLTLAQAHGAALSSELPKTIGEVGAARLTDYAAAKAGLIALHKSLTAELRADLCAKAVAAAKAVSYVGAGTIEFIFDRDSEQFYFMEMYSLRFL